MAKHHSPQPRTECQCEFCGTVFRVKCSNLRLGKVKGKFCSQFCYRRGLTTTEARFWASVVKTPACWLWTRRLNKDGYGQMKPTGNRIDQHAHRISWQLHNGTIPDGLKVLHHCDNPPCVNPAHLFLGTDKDNSDDMMRKGRNRPLRGEQNAASKISVRDVMEIRRRRTCGETLDSLARAFNVSDVTISRTVRRLSWRHVLA